MQRVYEDACAHEGVLVPPGHTSSPFESFQAIDLSLRSAVASQARIAVPALGEQPLRESLQELADREVRRRLDQREQEISMTAVNRPLVQLGIAPEYPVLIEGDSSIADEIGPNARTLRSVPMQTRDARRSREGGLRRFGKRI